MSCFKRKQLLQLRDGRLLNISQVVMICDHHLHGNNIKRVQLTSGKWLDDIHVSDVPKIVRALGVITT